MDNKVVVETHPLNWVYVGDDEDFNQFPPSEAQEDIGTVLRDILEEMGYEVETREVY